MEEVENKKPIKFDILSYHIIRTMPHVPARQNHMIEQFKKITPEGGNTKCNLFYGFNLDHTLEKCKINKSICKANKNRKRQIKYVENLPGALGCTISFYSAINIAKMANFPYVFILEDDIFFCDDFINVLNKHLENLPDDFEICILGRNRDDFEPIAYNDFLIKADNIHNNGGFALLINQKAYDKILVDFATNPVLLVDDFWYVNKYENSYCVKNNIIVSSPDPRYSTIEAREHITKNTESKSE